MNFRVRLFAPEFLTRRRSRFANRIENRSLGLFLFLSAHILENYNRNYKPAAAARLDVDNLPRKFHYKIHFGFLFEQKRTLR